MPWSGVGKCRPKRPAELSTITRNPAFPRQERTLCASALGFGQRQSVRAQGALLPEEDQAATGVPAAMTRLRPHHSSGSQTTSSTAATANTADNPRC